MTPEMTGGIGRSRQKTLEERCESARRRMEEWERDEPERRAQLEAEIARRASLHPIERLAEDGAVLRQKIESNDDMVAVLEVSRSARARCRAAGCFRAPAVDITDELRIRVEGIQNGFGYYRNKYYYHVICFDAMMDVDDMIPSGKFVCDSGEAWGLIVRKWFQHSGRINRKVLVKYIKDRKDWEMKRFGGMSPAVLRALCTAGQRDADDGTEAIASSSALPRETTVAYGKEDGCPVLPDYISNKNRVCLSLLVRLPDIWAVRMQLVLDPRQPLALQAIDPWPDVHEEHELVEYGPMTEDQANAEIERDKTRLDHKRHLLRAVWDDWHGLAPEVPTSSGLDSDEPELSEGVANSRKRVRSSSASGEESREKRRNAEGETWLKGEI